MQVQMQAQMQAQITLFGLQQGNSKVGGKNVRNAQYDVRRASGARVFRVKRSTE